LDIALPLLEEALEINQRIGYKHSEAVNLEYLGVLYSLKGEVNPALNFFVKSCNINKEIGNILGEATVLGNLGVLYAKEDPNKAIKFFKKALKIIDRIGVTDLQIQTLTNIAVIYFAIDNYEDGFKFLGQSLSISLPLQLNDIQYRLLIETIIKLNNRKDWNALKKIEVLYKSQYIIDERLVNLFKAIRSYSLTQLDVITNDEFIKIYDSLDPKSKIIFDYLIEFTQ
jgi:tetratricopeptide (TPR) repeat protein